MRVYLLAHTKSIKKYDHTVKRIHELYTELIHAGVPVEDAMFLLPNAADTKIIFTINTGEFIHFFTLRCCERVQW